MKLVDGELDLIACLTIISFILSLYFLYDIFRNRKSTEKMMMILRYVLKEVHDIKGSA